MATSNSKESTKTFIVNYFPLGSVIEVNLKDNQSLTYEKVLKEAGRILKLKSTSIRMFGLFMGLLGNPMKLCHHEHYADLPKGNKVLSFQRLSFNEELERIIVNDDEAAQELIFWELKEQYEANRILPKLKLDHSEFLEKAMMLLGKVSSSNRRRFVQVVFAQADYYWSYFYRASYCTVRYPITVNGKVCLERAKIIHVAVNAKKVVFVDTYGEIELASWQWYCVRSVKMQKSPQPLLKFEVFVVGSDEPVPLRMVTLETERNEYLYSLAVYILKIKEKEYFDEHGGFPYGPSIAMAEMATKYKVEEYLNKCFHNPAEAKKKQLHEFKDGRQLLQLKFRKVQEIATKS